MAISEEHELDKSSSQLLQFVTLKLKGQGMVILSQRKNLALILKEYPRGLPGGPMVRTRPAMQGHGFAPWQELKIPCATEGLVCMGQLLGLCTTRESVQ